MIRKLETCQIKYNFLNDLNRDIYAHTSEPTLKRINNDFPGTRSFIASYKLTPERKNR